MWCKVGDTKAGVVGDYTGEPLVLDCIDNQNWYLKSGLRASQDSGLNPVFYNDKTK